MQQKQGTTGGGSQDKKGTTGGDGREKTKTQDVGKTGREKTSRAVTTSDSKRATEEGGQKQFDFEEDDGTCSMVIECRDKKQLYCHKGNARLLYRLYLQSFKMPIFADAPFSPNLQNQKGKLCI